MRIKFSAHAAKRMGEKRQNGVTYNDVIGAAKDFMPNSKILVDMEIKGCKSKSGKEFSLVLSDKKNHRVIVTVVGL
jgi:hypothetical protein